jgi:hypothetical protein
MAATFLGLEPLLIAHLRTAAPALVRTVGAVRDIADAITRGQGAPGLYVGLESYRVVDDVARVVARIEQRWTVVTLVTNAAQADAAARLRAEADPIVTAVVQACFGWAPSADYSALELASGGVPPQYVAAMALFPVTFTTRFSMRAA